MHVPTNSDTSANKCYPLLNPNIKHNQWNDTTV